MKRSAIKRGSTPMKRTEFVTTKPRPGSRRWYVEKLDQKVRRIVKLREPACITASANCAGPLEVSHFWRRGFEQTRFDVDASGNNHTQCRRCNRRHNRDRRPYEKWFETRFGGSAHAILAILDYRAHSQQQFSIAELEALLKNLREQLSALTTRRRATAALMAQPYDDTDLPF